MVLLVLSESIHFDRDLFSDLVDAPAHLLVERALQLGEARGDLSQTTALLIEPQEESLELAGCSAAAIPQRPGAA